MKLRVNRRHKTCHKTHKHRCKKCYKQHKSRCNCMKKSMRKGMKKYYKGG